MMSNPDAFEILISFRIEDPRFISKSKILIKSGEVANSNEL